MQKQILITLLFSSLISFGAWMSLPIGPVPLTLQTAFVLMAGLLLPLPYATISVAIYLIVGGIGLPVFAGGKAGIETITGPTGGFLIGFLLASIAVSYLSRNTRYEIEGNGRLRIYWNAVYPCIIGSIVIQGCGMIWGKFYTGNDWANIYEFWIAPFYFNMTVKLIFAAVISAEIWQYFDLRRNKTTEAE